MRYKSLVNNEQIVELINRINKYKEITDVENYDKTIVDLTLEFLNLFNLNNGVKLNIAPYLYSFLFDNPKTKLTIFNGKIRDGSNYFLLEKIDENLSLFLGVRCKLFYEGTYFTFYDKYMLDTIGYKESFLYIETSNKTTIMNFDDDGYECSRIIQEEISLSHPFKEMDEKESANSDLIETISKLTRDDKDILKVHQTYKSKITKNGKELVDEEKKNYNLSKYSELLYGNDFLEKSPNKLYNEKYELFRQYFYKQKNISNKKNINK